MTEVGGYVACVTPMTQQHAILLQQRDTLYYSLISQYHKQHTDIPTKCSTACYAAAGPLLSVILSMTFSSNSFSSPSSSWTITREAITVST